MLWYNQYIDFIKKKRELMQHWSFVKVFAEKYCEFSDIVILFPGPDRNIGNRTGQVINEKY